MAKIKNFDIGLKYAEYMRILKLTRKPTRKEYMLISKISIAGILIIGSVGFVIYLFMVIIPGMF